jgi:hypothetical protein
MRRIWPLVICVPLLFATTLRVMGQSASDARNGYWWQSCPDLMKVGYVEGYVEGSDASSTVWKMEWKLYRNIEPKVHDNINRTSDKNLSQFASKLPGFSGQLVDFSGIRFGQYVGGLDAFYKDFRNMSIHVEDAMPYIRDQIKGDDKKELDIELSLLRKASTSPGYDQ